MFSTLIVPLDGSELAERALPYAVRFAQASHARLVLMQAVHAPPTASMEGANWEHEQLDTIAEARTYLARIAESLSAQLDGVSTAVLYGRPTDKILEAISAFQADGVVMTTHGRTGLDHLLHGSVTEGLLARSHIPVFVVCARPGQLPAPSFAPERARLLVPQNASEFDAAALQAAVEILGPEGEIVLETVVTPPEHVIMDQRGRHVLAYLDQQEEARTRKAREYLGGVAESLRNSPTPTSVKIDVRLGEPASGIVMAALDTQADLIVMATHGRTGLQRAMVGSVAGAVLRAACTPVVLVHPNITPPPDGGIVEPVVEEMGPVPTF
jgi:nucleotide-binding universal stress UspA family protein